MAKYSKREWDDVLLAAAVPKREMNHLVMDFFLCQGYVEAAREFRKEAVLADDIEGDDIEGIKERNFIRNAILNERFEEAIQHLEQLGTDIFEGNKRLLFRLRKHILIEKIKNGEISEAILFAQVELAPLTAQVADLRKELEEVLSLLLFDDIESSPLSFLLEKEELLVTARKVNAMILQFQGQKSDARLIHLFQEAQWSQDKLEEMHVDFPGIIRVNKKSH
uniref:CTLH domain-containing protein n=1 Tax=Mucochytrium quahogii TaxID=96639 RepID=A0A7S2SM91_9STRA|mmetsp:Transcript_555/g.943  ORF Transcript_555/g.943 Transcript_555/m.943 type:complete len:222 (+) Transcript_555:151-816(+)|eukprot:CAMPEP_0203768338 /NCGR_PEP_ID=MMETSP0099_2-20121227/1525_1 /ASSEMBLY_ACC=CAM_ASM_000209 /TAXON_ID=96639 /ORGANISM=" , Strain NY0313808BC1" /LENGTH=221 /DNA_ID=CAMNT_0050665003 /DNA_START=99 /DNA_END=764 /DNA_ORIENTATION=-